MVHTIPERTKTSEPFSPLRIYANFETARKLVGDIEAARIWNRSDANWPDALPIILPVKEI
jgi:hypothetical protein